MCRGTRRIFRDRCASLCSAHPIRRLNNLWLKNSAPYPLMPRRALAVLLGIARRGAASKPCFARGAGMSLLANPDKTARAQEASGIGRISFGYFSLAEKCSCIFCIHHILVVFRAKKSISFVGTRTHNKITVALATQLCSWFDKLTTNGFFKPSLVSVFQQSMLE
jgi:hypothetical protein